MNAHTYYNDIKNISEFFMNFTEDILLIIYDDINDMASEMTSFITSSNIVGMKKKYSNWNDVIKNYTLYITALLNIKTTHFNLMNVKDIENYEVKKFKEEFSDIDMYIREILSILAYYDNIFSGKYKLDSNAETYKDFHNIISNKLEKFNKSLTNFMSIIDINTKGSYEIENELTKFIQGGALGNTDTKSKSIKITGGCDIIGDNSSECYIKRKYIRYQLLKDDMNDDSNENLNFLINEQIKKSELSENELLDNMILESEIKYPIIEELKVISTIKIPEIINYISKRTPISIIFNINIDNIYESILTIMDTLNNIFLLLDKSDIDIIINTITKSFNFIDDIKNENDFKNEILNIQTKINKIDKIQIHLRHDIKINIKNKIKEIFSILDKLKKISSKKNNKTNKIKNDDKKIIINNNINNEILLFPILKKHEILYNDITIKLYELFELIDYLISPENKATCVNNIAFVFSFGVELFLLKKISNRFKNITNNMESIIKLFEDSTNIKIQTLYDNNNGLLLDDIKKIISDKYI